MTASPVPLLAADRLLLVALRLVVFALALGLTLISFQAYRRRHEDRLESAFVGFAFISMGVAVSTLGAYAESNPVLFGVAEAVTFIVGFAMLYLSLYR
ncbi:MAG: hypothetical protein ABEJ61_05555 [Haloferacaceae archaeon]